MLQLPVVCIPSPLSARASYAVIDMPPHNAHLRSAGNRDTKPSALFCNASNPPPTRSRSKTIELFPLSLPVAPLAQVSEDFAPACASVGLKKIEQTAETVATKRLMFCHYLRTKQITGAPPYSSTTKYHGYREDSSGVYSRLFRLLS